MEQLHNVYDKSDNMNNKNFKGKVKGEEEEDDREREFRRTHRHGFQDQMWAKFQVMEKDTTNEVEKFKALVYSILGVMVPFEPHAKNVHILSSFSNQITG